MLPKRGAAEYDPDELTSPPSFVKLMALERLEETEKPHAHSTEPEKIERFRSLAVPFPPGEGSRSFGGHVYAQSAYAASKTVGKGFVVHVSYLPNPDSCKHLNLCMGLTLDRTWPVHSLWLDG